MNYQHIGVAGAGSWGTALALVACSAGRAVTLWAREADVAQDIARRHENRRYFPGLPLPAGIRPCADLETVAQAAAILLVMPAQHLRAMVGALAPFVRPGTPLVICAKGIERSSGLLMTEVLAQCAPMAVPAVLSGPSFARDVAQGLPTAVTIAAAQRTVAERLQAALSSSSFRPYASDDIVGAALGGAAKNVYAIGCGIVEGLNLGESARAALLARAFAELSRLGEALGGRRETLMGLCGLGDLVLTASSRSSRNFSCGIAIAQGQGAFCGDGAPLAEGVETAPALVARARAAGVELPIAEAVADILSGRLSLDDAAARLMLRPLKTE